MRGQQQENTMSIQGSCLCGGVAFEIDEASGPFELCHCNRCRKASGAAAMPGLTVKRAHFRFLRGEDLIRTFVAPILYAPPPYQTHFCSVCGSPVPRPHADADEVELAAGLLDGDPGIKPDKHIFVEHLPAWDSLTDTLPTFTLHQLVKYRRRRQQDGQT